MEENTRHTLAFNTVDSYLAQNLPNSYWFARRQSFKMRMASSTDAHENESMGSRQSPPSTVSPERISHEVPSLLDASRESQNNFLALHLTPHPIIRHSVASFDEHLNSLENEKGACCRHFLTTFLTPTAESSKERLARNQPSGSTVTNPVYEGVYFSKSGINNWVKLISIL